MKILGSGTKIKRIRKNLKLSQKDLSKGILSLSMLSYIESEKHPLKGDLAMKLVERLNMYSPTSIDYKKICIGKKTLYEDKLNNILKNIKLIKNRHINQFINSLSTENYTDLEYKAKSIFSSIYFNRYNNYIVSKKYLEEIIDIEDETTKNFYPLNLLLLQRIYIYTEDYKKLNQLYCRHNKKLKKISTTKIKGNLYYNFGLSLEIKNQEEEAINNYSTALKYFKNKQLEDLCNNNIGVCYCKLKEYEKSNEIYLDLLKNNPKDIEKARYYSNLLINYIELKEDISVKNTVNKLNQSLSNIARENTIKYQSYMCLGKGYLYLEDRYNAMKAFEMELQLGVGNRNNHFFFENYKYCINQLMAIYHIKDIKKFNNLEKYINQLPTTIIDSEFLIKILYYYSKVYEKEDILRFNKVIYNKFYQL